VISPYLNGLKDYKHLSFASSLCGKCTEVCPVKIPLHELLLVNRNDSVKKGYATGSEKFAMRMMKKVLLKRKWMEMGNAGLKNRALKLVFSKAWGPRRDFPVIQNKSFHKMWLEERESKNVKH
jgi:L-lactate dehydrogenase complex protein LldF